MTMPRLAARACSPGPQYHPDMSAVAPVPRICGREAEIQALGAALGRVAAGRPEIVLVEGEAGIGKTRLLAHALADARGRGMLLGLEIVQDGSTGTDFPDPIVAGNELRARCRDLGLISLILHPGNILFLAPPLVTSDSDIDRIVAIIDQALTEMEAAWA